MAAKEFIVRSDPVGCGWSVWFRLYLYYSNEDLQKAARKYSKHENVDYDGCEGCFHPNLVIGVKPDGSSYHTKNTKRIGIMRLSLESVDIEHVVHECTHAAIAYVNALKLKEHGYMVGNSNLGNEEPLCYAAGAFSAAVTSKLWSMGYLL